MMTTTERMYLKITPKTENDPQDETLIDLAISEDGSYVINKIVFLQPNVKTGEEHWVIYPKEYWSMGVDHMKHLVEAEIKRVQNDNSYSGEEYRKILASTRRKMVLQDRG